MATIDVSVAATADDCRKFWNPGLVAWSFSTIAIYFFAGQDTGNNTEKVESGARFLGVTIPNGAVVTTAYLTLKCALATAGTVCRTRLQGEQSETAAQFSDQANYDARTWTTAVVDWDGIAAWTDNISYNSAEIKSIIQELVDDYAGLTNADIVIRWGDWDDRSDTPARRIASSWDDSDVAPALHIEYTVGMGAQYVNISPFGVTMFGGKTN